MNSDILVTGASGFIGRSVCVRLSASQRIKAQYRNLNISNTLPNVEDVSGELSRTFDWRDALRGVGVVVHCAARAHILDQGSSDPLTQFREINTYGTLNLASQAAECGVKQFIFLSSLAVNGADSGNGEFLAESVPNPSTPYSISKYEAELGLWRISSETGMSVTILRPPLVYGANAPGKFGMLARCVNSRIPLPLGALKSKRCFIFLDNLVDLIVHCIDQPNAANQTFLASDDQDISIAQLIREIGRALDRTPLLLPVPIFILKMAALVLGRSKDAQQLLGALRVNVEKTKSRLNWRPPFSVEVGVRKAINGSDL